MEPAPPYLRSIARAAVALNDEKLIAECEIDYFVAGGPGGQHRNKTESGVRLTHRASGITVIATERRSQGMNRDVALERLREKLRALTVVPKVRRATKPTKGSQERRIAEKKRDSKVKAGRRGDYD